MPKNMITYLNAIGDYISNKRMVYSLMTHEIDSSNKKVSFKETELKRRKGIYISKPETVPDEIIDGIKKSIQNSRLDHALGIYSYFFTPISRSELSERYITKRNHGGAKQSSVFYIQKHVITPTYKEIKTECKDLENITLLEPNKPGMQKVYTLKKTNKQSNNS